MIHIKDDRYVAVCIECFVKQEMEQFFSKQIVSPSKKMRLVCQTCINSRKKKK